MEVGESKYEVRRLMSADEDIVNAAGADETPENVEVTFYGKKRKRRRVS